MPFPTNSASKPIFVRQYGASENEIAREKKRPTEEMVQFFQFIDL